jgi:hypothetical protein
MGMAWCEVAWLTGSRMTGERGRSASAASSRPTAACRGIERARAGVAAPTPPPDATARACTTANGSWSGRDGAARPSWPRIIRPGGDPGPPPRWRPDPARHSGVLRAPVPVSHGGVPQQAWSILTPAHVFGSQTWQTVPVSSDVGPHGHPPGAGPLTGISGGGPMGRRRGGMGLPWARHDASPRATTLRRAQINSSSWSPASRRARLLPPRGKMGGDRQGRRRGPWRPGGWCARQRVADHLEQAVRCRAWGVAAVRPTGPGPSRDRCVCP